MNTKTSKPEDIVNNWKSKFKKAEKHREPFIKKNLRMLKLYKAIRDKVNYGYETSIMPPIAFKIIETVKPRLTSSKLTLRLVPQTKEDVGKMDAIKSWETLINYFLAEEEIGDKKADLVLAMLLFGNGYLKVTWGKERPKIEHLDNWLLYFDPTATNRLKGSRYEIIQIFKTKKQLKAEEDKREVKIYDRVDWNKVEDRDNSKNDPRIDRWDIENRKMGIIKTSKEYQQDDDEEEVNQEYKNNNVEVWEIYDHENNEIITIFNREILAGVRENVYNGSVIVDLPGIKQLWNAFAMSILEPVESLIHEIADTRNQVMDNFVFNLDPIKKVRKNSHVDIDDLQVHPGAVWELTNIDDVITEPGTPINPSWMDRDIMLVKEIQETLALSEYTVGMPHSKQEPSSKVEILLNQTNIRLAQFLRQLEIAMNDLVDKMISYTNEFITEDIVDKVFTEKDEIKVVDFKADNLGVRLKSMVDIAPKIERSAEQKLANYRELYQMFILEDQKQLKDDPIALKKIEKKKQVLRQLILDEMDLGEYADILLGVEETTEKEAQIPTDIQVGQPIPIINEGGAAPPTEGVPPQLQIN